MHPSCLRFPNDGITATIPNSAVKFVCVCVSEDNLRCHTTPVHPETFRCCCPCFKGLSSTSHLAPGTRLSQDSGESNSGPHASVAHALPTELDHSTSPVVSPRTLPHTWSWVSIRGHPEPAFTATKIANGQMVHSPCSTTTCS